MTASDVLLDTSAWIEVLRGSAAGKKLQTRFLSKKTSRVHASVLSVAELTAKVAPAGGDAEVAHALASIRAHSRLHAVSDREAEAGGRLRAQLRARDPDASLIDAVVLATARSIGARLVTNDRALVGEPDVIGF